MTNFEKVKIFMESFGQEVKHKPAVPDIDIIELRLNLINEEFIELVNAAQESREEDENVSQKDKLIDVADALADLLYVVYGAAAAFGIGIDEIFDEVHDSNMSKLDEDGNPIYNKIGKVMKGPNYFKPKIATLLLKQKGLVWK